MKIFRWGLAAARELGLSWSLALLLAAPALAATTPSSSKQAAPTTPDAIVKAEQSWRQAILKQPQPGSGCFQASYPDPTWHPVTCAKAPAAPQIAPAMFRPKIVGNTVDWAASVAGKVSSMTGSFNGITGLHQITGSPKSASNFALQLNTNTFNSPACRGTGCQGWEQFIYSNTGATYIEYSLINYAGNCPNDWSSYNNGGQVCYFNSPATSVPVQSLDGVANLTLTATAAANGNDSVTVATSLTRAYTASYHDNVDSLSQGWTGAEYNIVGDTNGSQANFNAGVSISIRLAVNASSTGAAPSCVANGGTTGETNNLNLAQDCATSGQAILFTEANTPLINSVTPVTGPATGGTLVTLTGSGFTGATGVTFFQSTFPATAVPFTVKSDNVITATAPACPPSTCDTTIFGDLITVTGPSGSGRAAQGFHPFPKITGINPPSGPPGTAVTVGGNGFSLARPPAFAFNGVPAGDVQCPGNGNIACTMTVPSLGTGPATVSFPGAPPNPPADQFTVTGGVVTTCSFQLLSCPAGGGNQVYSVTCGAPHDFYVDQSFQKTATVFTGQEASAEQATGVKACFPGTQNCQSYTTTATMICPINPPQPPPKPITNCRVCEQTGRKCVPVTGGFKCVGNIQ
jgi:hypothetical protein